MLTDYLGRDAQSLGEQFRWIDEVTPEDQGWFLHEIEHRFGRNKNVQAEIDNSVPRGVGNNRSPERLY
jgi:hypothetical protein